jgi:hypothetical protein
VSRCGSGVPQEDPRTRAKSGGMPGRPARTMQVRTSTPHPPRHRIPSSAFLCSFLHLRPARRSRRGSGRGRRRGRFSPGSSAARREGVEEGVDSPALAHRWTSAGVQQCCIDANEAIQHRCRRGVVGAVAAGVRGAVAAVSDTDSVGQLGRGQRTHRRGRAEHARRASSGRVFTIRPGIPTSRLNLQQRNLD